MIFQRIHPFLFHDFPAGYLREGGYELKLFSEEMMGPLHRFHDNDHLYRLIETVRGSGISVTEDHRAKLLGAYWFRKGLGKIHGSIGIDEWESMMYFGFGHPFNPLLWYSDGILLKKIETIFLSQGSERVHPSDTESEDTRNT